MSCSIVGIGAVSLPPTVRMAGAIVAAVEQDVENVRQQRNDWISQAEQQLQKLLNNQLSTDQVAQLLENWMSEGKGKNKVPSVAYSSVIPIHSRSSRQTSQAEEAAENIVSAPGRRRSSQVDYIALDLEMANSAVGLIVCHGQNCSAYRRPVGLQVDYIEWPCTRPSRDYTFLGSDIQELSSLGSVVEWQQLDANQTALHTVGHG